MYESVCLEADGPTTPARFAATAARYGFDGLVYRVDPDRTVEPLAPIADEYDLDLAACAVVRVTDRASASQAIQQLRDDVDVLCMAAETTELRRFVAEQDRVDVLRWSIGDGRPIGHAVARTAAAHGVFIELDIGPVLRTTGGRRVRAIDDVRRVARLADHEDLPVVLTGTPASHLQLRAPRELRALAQAIDVPDPLATSGLSNWGRILERSRRARSDTFIEPGVRRAPDEADDR